MTDKVAIVTAASQGIGAACAEALGEAGWRLVLMSRSERAAELAKRLGGVALQGDVTSPADLERLVELATGRWGRVDAVVNNTGHGAGSSAVKSGPSYDPDGAGHLLDIEDAAWHAGLDTYMLNVVRMARLVTPIMERQGGGAIVNISALSTVEPRPEYPMSVLRLALHGFTKLYADRYARAGIRMNNLLPGFIENWPLPESVVRHIPAGRTGRLEEIGATAAFLVSDAAAYITGQNILVDGGLTRGVR